MTVTTTQLLTLEEFLKLPETKPAREYINGEITRKDLEKRMLEKTLEHEYAKPFTGEPFKINEYVW